MQIDFELHNVGIGKPFFRDSGGRPVGYDIGFSWILRTYDLTRSELADKLGVTYYTVSEIIRNPLRAAPSAELMVRLARMLTEWG